MNYCEPWKWGDGYVAPNALLDGVPVLVMTDECSRLFREGEDKNGVIYTKEDWENSENSEMEIVDNKVKCFGKDYEGQLIFTY